MTRSPSARAIITTNKAVQNSRVHALLNQTADGHAWLAA
jgi:hypothetical protein